MSSLIAHDWAALLLASSEEVLETMFFCSILHSSPGPFLGEAISANLRFEGSPSGIVTVDLSSIAAREMSATFLGIEADVVSDSQMDQVVGELANIICGHTLSKASFGETFRLTHPEIVRAVSARPFDSTSGIVLQIENGFFAAFIGLDPDSLQ